MVIRPGHLSEPIRRELRHDIAPKAAPFGGGNGATVRKGLEAPFCNGVVCRSTRGSGNRDEGYLRRTRRIGTTGIGRHSGVRGLPATLYLHLATRSTGR